MIYRIAFSALAVVAVLSSPAAARVVLRTDFDSAPSGAITAAGLDGLTTGGTWTLNTGRGANYTIEGTGDKALLLDDPDNTGNAGVIHFSTLRLDAPVDISSVKPMTWDFRTAARRVQNMTNNKGLRFEFVDSSGDVGATVEWWGPSNVNLNNGQATSNAVGFDFHFPWDPLSTAVKDFSLLFEGNDVLLNFGGEQLVGTLLNGVTDIQELRIYSTMEQSQTRGLFLDDITVTVAPEPASVAAWALAGFGLLLAVHARRRRCAARASSPRVL